MNGAVEIGAVTSGVPDDVMGLGDSGAARVDDAAQGHVEYKLEVESWADECGTLKGGNVVRYKM